MAKPKLALIPAAQGSKFYSVLPSDGVGDFDFARASAATRINKYGLIETVASGQSRLNYPLIDGVVNGCPSHLLEPARINLITYSEDFSNAAWIKQNLTVNANQAISPDGTLTADEFTPNATTDNIRIYQTQTTSALTYSLSFFVKYNGKQYVQLLFGSGLNSIDFCNFDLINGIVTNGTGNIENYGNGWYRISLISSLNASTDQVYLWSIDSPNASRGASSTGNGIDGYYIWGAQFEIGSYGTSYIVSNSGSATTRVAETAKNAGDASTFNDSEGVLMAEISALESIASSNRWITIYDASATDNFIAFVYDTSGSFAFYVAVNGTTSTYLSINIDATQPIKVLGKYKENDFSLWLNGFEILTDNIGSTFTNGSLDSFNFDARGISNSFYGKTKQIQYYDSALTDSELETLTSWTSFSEMATSQLYSIQ